jgi:hypothetical protein
MLAVEAASVDVSADTLAFVSADKSVGAAIALPARRETTVAAVNLILTLCFVISKLCIAMLDCI